jgi:hypothetical protein
MPEPKTYELVEALNDVGESFNIPKGCKVQGKIENLIIITTLPGVDFPRDSIEYLQKSLPDQYTVLILNGAFGLQFLKLKEIP